MKEQTGAEAGWAGTLSALSPGLLAASVYSWLLLCVVTEWILAELHERERGNVPHVSKSQTARCPGKSHRTPKSFELTQMEEAGEVLPCPTQGTGGALWVHGDTPGFSESEMWKGLAPLF